MENNYFKEYNELKALLEKANKSYYKDSESIMSDYEYDLKLKRLEWLENQLNLEKSDLTGKPGSDLSSNLNLDNSHGRPCLSLENTYNIEDVKSWVKSMFDATGDKNLEFIVNPKWDGMSGVIRYQSGEVYKGLSRGNGIEGEDMTQNIQFCQKNYWASKNNFSGEARGELIMTKAGFEDLNKDGSYQNARNLVSGSMKLLNVDEFAPRGKYINFLAYWLEDSKNEKYNEDLDDLKKFGFEVGPYYICHSVEDILEAINKIEVGSYEYAIDGAVIKLNNKKYWESIGSTAKFPRWARAYKYKQETAIATVEDITYEVGRTGKVTGVCWFTPVFIDGSTISKATLNNKEWQEHLDIAVGDKIEIHKAAAIIPEIIQVIERPNNRRKIPFPEVCPICGEKLSKTKEDYVDMFCLNPECKGRAIAAITHYTSTIECDGFAEVLVERLYDAGYLKSITDLYKLKWNKLKIALLPRFSGKIIEKMCQNIEDSKTQEFYKLLAGLGIPNVGLKTSKILCKHFNNIAEIENATVEELTEIESIGENSAVAIKDWFKNNKKLLRELESEGVKFKNVKSEKVENDFLAGKSFCITGKLSLPREKYIDLIETSGGSVVSAVSKKTNYLVTNDKHSGSNKNMKAAELGIPVISERELLELSASIQLLKELGDV